jgi:hypothetical protein
MTTRREFLRTSAGLAAALPLGASVFAKPVSATNKMIAIQIGAVSFVDEGIESCLDILQERGAVNTIIPAVFSYSRGTAGRHKPYPGHGKNVQDTRIVGGNYATVHPSFYKDILFDPMLTQAPDHPGFDVLGDLIPHTRKRGMKVISLFQNAFNEQLPNAEKYFEYDFNGKMNDDLCFNNPYHRNFMTGLIDDYINSYDIDGLLYINETQGAFTNMIGARFRGRRRGLPGSRTCFCQYCKSKAKKQGISIERLQTAFEEAEKFVKAGRSHRRPVDGYYVSFWRLILRYPELLEWEHFFHESYKEVYKLFYDHVKDARKDALFGLHIWTNASFNPLYRAEQDFAELSQYTDFLKIALYNNCGGPRFASYLQSFGDTVFGDLPLEEMAQFHYRILNYPSETPFPRVSETGLSPNYVHREVKRVLDGRGEGGAKILAGIDVDIPLSDLDIVEGAREEDAARTTRQRVYEATKAALKAGADGIVISRKYSEMKLENMSGIGDAVRES